MASKGSSGPCARPLKEIKRDNRPPIKFRIVRRFYRASNSPTKSLEMVLHDVEGGRITAVVKAPHMKALDKQIVQGRVYALRRNNYYVEGNTGKYRTTIAKFRVVFHGQTKLVEIPEESFFPDYIFDFRDYTTLVDPNTIDETQLFDIIGKVNFIHSAQERDYNGKAARLIEILLEDLSGNQLSCTLWGDYVDEILAFEKAVRSGPPNIILQLCRAKVWNERVYLSNSFDTTQIHTLETIPAIELFSSQITNDRLDHTPPMSRGSLTSFRAELDELSKGLLTVNPIETIFMVDEAAHIWVCGILSNIIGTWSYLACNKCNKKLERVGMEYICDVCHKTTKTGVYRYKLTIEVIDRTGNVSLLCWDKDAERLTGRPCQELREEYIENLKADNTNLPMSLMRLIDQTVLFKVKVETKQLHKDGAVFAVSRLVTDPQIVAKYNNYTAEAESEADFLTMMLNEENNFDVMSNDEEVNTPIKNPDLKTVGEGVVAPKCLDFEKEATGSTTSKRGRNMTMTAKQYYRKLEEKVAKDGEDDAMPQAEEQGDSQEDEEKRSG